MLLTLKDFFQVCWCGIIVLTFVLQEKKNMKILKIMAVVALFASTQSSVASEKWQNNELDAQEPGWRSRYKEDPEGRWIKNSYTGVYEWKTSTEVAEIRKKRDEYTERDRLYNEQRENTISTLNELATYINTSPFRVLKTPQDINDFAAGMRLLLDQVEEKNIKFRKNKQALREIQEAREHINAHKRFRDEKDREQFRRRMLQFVDELRAITNNIYLY
jgi:hypothetical protein